MSLVTSNSERAAPALRIRISDLLRRRGRVVAKSRSCQTGHVTRYTRPSRAGRFRFTLLQPFTPKNEITFTQLVNHSWLNK